MEWESNERDAWVADAQRWVTQIIGVNECVISLNDLGEIVAVHVVASSEKAPRHIVRDVETLLKARLDLDLDYKKISVTQVMDPPPEESEPPLPGVSFHDTQDHFQDDAVKLEEPLAPAAEESLAPPAIPAVVLAEESSPRVICANVGLMSGELTVRAEVLLQAGELEALGVAEGPNHASSDHQVLAEATVKALCELLADPVLLHVREIRTESLGNQSILLTAIDLVEGRRSETLFGACSAAHNRQQAVVYAVLDALNRRLALLGLKSTRSQA